AGRGCSREMSPRSSQDDGRAGSGRALLERRDAPLESGAVPGRRLRRVVLAGDSTVAPYVATAYPMSGWGAHLGAALTARCTAGGGPASPFHVIDLAKNGAPPGSTPSPGSGRPGSAASPPRIERLP